MYCILFYYYYTTTTNAAAAAAADSAMRCIDMIVPKRCKLLKHLVTLEVRQYCDKLQVRKSTN